jgi:hypothetical protein
MVSAVEDDVIVVCARAVPMLATKRKPAATKARACLRMALATPHHWRRALPKESRIISR